MKGTVSRRSFLWVSQVAVLLDRAALPQSNPVEAWDEYHDFETSEPPDLRLLGTDPALSAEVARADKLLLAAPEKALPLDVMRYLESLPDRNVDNEAYNGGWRKRWNPLIVRFFSETNTVPSGDTTAWCAAALNWTLAHCQLRGTHSASSGSFRSAPGITTRPKPGDIVVFSRTDAEEAKVGHGHVGLLLDQNEEAILVLGGNQKNKFGHHAVCRKWLKRKDEVLTFQSFHSIASFPRL